MARFPSPIPLYHTRAHLSVKKLHNAQVIRVDPVAVGMGQEDVFKKGELLGQQLDTRLQLFVLLKKRKNPILEG